MKRAQSSFKTFEIVFFLNHTKTLSFHCMLNTIKWKFVALQIKEQDYIYTENSQQEMRTSVSCSLNVIHESIITIICMQTTYITNIESVLQKIF